MSIEYVIKDIMSDKVLGLVNDDWTTTVENVPTLPGHLVAAFPVQTSEFSCIMGSKDVTYGDEFYIDALNTYLRLFGVYIDEQEKGESTKLSDSDINDLLDSTDTAATKSHTLDRCMECDQPPTKDVIWANGMAHAWFCDDHFDSWSAEHPGEVDRVKPVDGIAMNTKAASMHTGVITEFLIDGDTAEKLAIHDASGFYPYEAPSYLHLTLTFHGEHYAMSMQELAHLIVAAETIARCCGPLDGVISGIGRFQASDSSDGKDVIYASVDMPGLNTFREALASDLDALGVPPRKEHGFTPHITLAYVGPGEVSPVSEVELLPLHFDNLVVGIGETMVSIPLTGPVMGQTPEEVPAY